MIALVGLLACDVNTTETGDTAATCLTGLEGVIYGADRVDPPPEAGGHIEAVDTEGEAISTVADADGKWALPAWPGTWTVSATNASQDCFTDPDPEVEVVACDTPFVELFTELCYGR